MRFRLRSLVLWVVLLSLFFFVSKDVFDVVDNCGLRIFYLVEGLLF